MGAVEHLKTLCCLGLKPESAMITVTPLLHEIVPHGWTLRPGHSLCGLSLFVLMPVTALGGAVFEAHLSSTSRH